MIGFTPTASISPQGLGRPRSFHFPPRRNSARQYGLCSNPQGREPKLFPVLADPSEPWATRRYREDVESQPVRFGLGYLVISNSYQRSCGPCIVHWFCMVRWFYTEGPHNSQAGSACRHIHYGIKSRFRYCMS